MVETPVVYFEGVLDFENKLECKCEEFGMYNHTSIITVKVPQHDDWNVSLSTCEVMTTKYQIQSSFVIEQIAVCKSCNVELQDTARCHLTYTPSVENAEERAIVVVMPTVGTSDQIITVKLHTPGAPVEDLQQLSVS
jgi:hypothetical protein